MKYLNILILWAFVAMGVTACSDDDMYEAPSRPIEFTVGSTEMSFVRTGATRSLYVEATSAPSVSTTDTWIHLTTPTLNGESDRIYAISVTVDENSGYNDRTGSISVSQGSNNATVKVTQTAGEGLIIDITQKSLEAAGGTFTVNVQATADYTVEMPSWITRSESRSLDSYTEQFTAATNRSLDRSGEIVFTLSSDNTITAVIAVTQAGVEATSGTLAKDVIKQINAGWNLGNTLEACNSADLTGGETMWGNPTVSQAFINSVKEAGFNAIRLPAAWHCHMADMSTYTIDPTWLARVQEIVDYCINADMIVVLNTHWDAGWLELNCTSAQKDAVIEEEKAIWTQIANQFKDYGDNLLFAGANEVRSTRNGSEWWGQPNADEQATLEEYMQVFVDAVRATGGNNLTRNLVVQCWCCNGWYGLNGYNMPDDVEAGHLIFEYHFYDPMAMTHASDVASATTTWGYRAGYVSADDGYQEDFIDDYFARFKSEFVDAGYPVIIGEYGTNCWSLEDETIMASQAYYLEYINKVAKNNGIATFYWDNATGDIGNFGLFSRVSNKVNKQHLVDGIMLGAAEGVYPY